MQSKEVRRAVVALLVALTLAVLAWGVKSIAEAFALLHTTLSVSRIIDPTLDPSDQRIQLIVLAAGIVVVLMIAGYVVFSKLRNAEDESNEKSVDGEAPGE